MTRRPTRQEILARYIHHERETRMAHQQQQRPPVRYAEVNVRFSKEFAHELGIEGQIVSFSNAAFGHDDTMFTIIREDSARMFPRGAVLEIELVPTRLETV
jgi:hypothetical protein